MTEHHPWNIEGRREPLVGERKETLLSQGFLLDFFKNDSRVTLPSCLGCLNQCREDGLVIGVWWDSEEHAADFWTIRYKKKKIYFAGFCNVYDCFLYKNKYMRGKDTFENYCKNVSVMIYCQPSQGHSDVKFLPYNATVIGLNLIRDVQQNLSCCFSIIGEIKISVTQMLIITML